MGQTRVWGLRVGISSSMFDYVGEGPPSLPPIYRRDDGRRIKIRRIKLFFAGNSDQRDQGITPGLD